MRWQDIQIGAVLVLLLFVALCFLMAQGCAELEKYEMKIQRKDTSPYVERFPAPEPFPSKKKKRECREYDYNGKCL